MLGNKYNVNPEDYVKHTSSISVSSLWTHKQSWFINQGKTFKLRYDLNFWFLPTKPFLKNIEPQTNQSGSLFNKLINPVHSQ